jgi:hypothetical protein
MYLFIRHLALNYLRIEFVHEKVRIELGQSSRNTNSNLRKPLNMMCYFD